MSNGRTQCASSFYGCLKEEEKKMNETVQMVIDMKSGDWTSATLIIDLAYSRDMHI